MKKIQNEEMEMGWESQFTTLLREILNTRETRQILGMAIPEVVNLWARNGVDTPAGLGARTKIKLAGLVGGKIGKGFLPKNGPDTENHFTALLGKPEVSETLQKLISGALNGTPGQLGGLLTRLAKTVNENHQNDPEFITKFLEPGVKNWIKSTDFGELKEAFEKSATDGRSLVEMINNAIWQYPSKMVMILSFLPSFANMVTCSLGISIEKLNNMPPDLLTDIMLAYLKDINTDSMSCLINELAEIVRKAHTGSALLGEPGAPQLPKVVGTLIEEIISGLNPEVMWKAKIGLAEIKSDLDLAHRKAVHKNGASQLSLAKKPELTNIRARSFNSRLSFFEALDDSELADNFEKHLTAYDIQEMAEALNNTLSLFNRMQANKPELFTSVIRQFVDSVDPYELSETAKWIAEEAGTEIKPLARSVIPKLVTWTCDILKPVDDEYEEDATRAREALRSLLMTENLEV
ncbi:hypothetical protein KKA14_13425 [bacterium]|nr:hypothetical protein [bacterium]